MQKYKHVIVFGIDGAGAFIREADTPNFDRIFKDGAVTFDALSCKPTISAECWGAMLLGVGPEIHGLNNNIVTAEPYPTDSVFPTLFRRIRKVMPEAELGSFCEWNPISTGIVEADQNVTKVTARTVDLIPIICDYIKEKKPTFLFTQFDTVDAAGHNFGYGSDLYLQRINLVDGLLNDVYETLKGENMLDDTLFLLIADHGGTPFDGTGARHGGWSDAEKYVTFAALGKGVKAGELGAVNIRDLAAVVLYALGIEAPEFAEDGWTSQIPEGLFEDESIPAYRDISHLTGAELRVSKAPHATELL